ncbi:MAG: bifunctional demethylmenaquinone methyltransferase/2-methoxy-6-polyprenyl-1,4-benzoquinol methylase UbiE [Chloroflexaceae bacterium]|nr:bifunctional demethylmenaquinone methyltransferase/2-methoxy-6-polyprenyl-1,4-benzoquinol methylase UbiE [Chloroflexaceae bacterium]
MSAYPRANAAEIQGIFNRIAPVYDQFNDRLSFRLHRLWKRMTVKWSGAKPGDRALDLCCGSGDLALLLAKSVRRGEVVGVDYSSELLAIARDRARQAFVPASLSWIEADVLSLPWEDEQFDCATMGYGLRNVTDIPRCLQELYRVLKPQAQAAILDFHRPDAPILQGFQDYYLSQYVVPLAEELGLAAEYAYISPSLARFPKGKNQVQLARQVGFQAVHYPILGGLMGVLQLHK